LLVLSQKVDIIPYNFSQFRHIRCGASFRNRAQSFTMAHRRKRLTQDSDLDPPFSI